MYTNIRHQHCYHLWRAPKLLNTQVKTKIKTKTWIAFITALKNVFCNLGHKRCRLYGKSQQSIWPYVQNNELIGVIFTCTAAWPESLVTRKHECVLGRASALNSSTATPTRQCSSHCKSPQRPLRVFQNFN